MKINIHKYLDGAKSATGLGVLFDVFRASNTIIACLEKGAEYIIPVGDLQEAYDIKKANPDHLLFGERDGIPPPGFDFDNSPANASQRDLRGQKIILTTSSGSQGIVHAKNVDELIIGSFANADAIIEYLHASQHSTISLIAIGDKGLYPALEDESCAQYIQAEFLNYPTNFLEIKQELLQCKGADRLKRLKQDDDLQFCTTLNSHRIIPVFDRSKTESLH